MGAHHENTTAVANALARDLNEEYTAMMAAQRAGQTSLAQALAGSMQAQQTEILHYKLNLPPNESKTSQGNGHATTPGPNGDPHGGSGAGRPSPTPPEQGSGHSGGNQGGSQGGNQGSRQSGDHGGGSGDGGSGDGGSGDGGSGDGGSGGQGRHAAVQATRTVGVAESIAVPVQVGPRRGGTHCQARVRR
jgi:hypothetical protein